MPVRIDELVSEVSGQRGSGAERTSAAATTEDDRRASERRAALDARLRPEDPDG